MKQENNCHTLTDLTQFDELPKTDWQLNQNMSDFEMEIWCSQTRKVIATLPLDDAAPSDTEITIGLLVESAPQLLEELKEARARMAELEGVLVGIEGHLDGSSYNVWTRDYGNDDVVSVETIKEEIAKHRGEK